MLGGVVRRNYRSLVGVLTEDALRQVARRLAFLGTSGMRADGQVMDTTIVEVPVKRAMIAAADAGRAARRPAQVPRLRVAARLRREDIDVLVTNDGPTRRRSRRARGRHRGVLA